MSFVRVDAGKSNVSDDSGPKDLRNIHPWLYGCINIGHANLRHFSFCEICFSAFEGVVGVYLIFFSSV